MTHWFSSCFNPTPVHVFSCPFDFDPRVLPHFYESLILTWLSLDDSFFASPSASDGFIFTSLSDPHSLIHFGMMTKSWYQYLLSENLGTPTVLLSSLPRCVLYWSAWRELFFFDSDHQVIDLSWKITHGVLYTAARLASFGYDFNVLLLCSSFRDPWASILPLSPCLSCSFLASVLNVYFLSFGSFSGLLFCPFWFQLWREVTCSWGFCLHSQCL